MAKVSQYKDLIKCVKDFYVAGKPLHAYQDLNQSTISIISESALKAQTVQECQSNFSRQHLLITQMVIDPMKFDEAGLETIKSVGTVVDVYGQKIFVHCMDMLCSFD